MADVLLWPIDLEPGNDAFPTGGRIPFVVFHILRVRWGFDISEARYSWARRGKKLFDEVIRLAAEQLRSVQPKAGE